MPKKENISPTNELPIVKITNYPDALIHEGKTKSGNTFRTVSFRFRDAWASFFIDKDSLHKSIGRNGDSIPGKSDITLGDPEDIRRVSVNQADGSYDSVWMFNHSIRDFIHSNKMNYLRSIAI